MQPSQRLLRSAQCLPDFASSVLSAFSVATFARVASAREASEAVFGELLVEGHLDSGPPSERIQALALLPGSEPLTSAFILALNFQAGETKLRLHVV